MRIFTQNVSVGRAGMRFPLWGVALLAGLAATTINLVVGQIMTPLVHAPADYPSFTWLPVITGCMLGAVGGYISYLMLTRWTSRPKAIFLLLATGVLVASYVLPILPIVYPERRFAGVNWGIAFTLMGMHTITAILIVSTMLLWKPGTQQGKKSRFY